jgi:asparagine synthase (glutamine-hydrolysing)
MRAADLPRAPSADQQDQPYPDWILVATRRGDLELSPAADTSSDGGGAPSRPQVARHGPCAALFDGVLYNRAELERVLGAEGSTDGDLALQAYQRWGERVLLELKGIYVLVVGDTERERVICARDRLGSYSLFYAESGGDLLLSTSIEVLLRDPRVSGEVNRAALADHLAHNWPDPGETYFSAIRRVPPGQALVGGSDGRRIGRYWDPIPSDGEIDWVSEDELEHFEDLLQAAVGRFLALGPAGIFLSGGLDSVSVAAIAARTSRETGMPAPWALSLGFSDQEANEQAIQRSVAADLDLPQLLVPLEEAAGPEGLLAGSLELNRHCPAPAVNLWMPAYIHLATLGRQHGCRVILTGHGGDEWLSVTPFLAADLLLSLDLKGFFRLWENHRRSYPIPPLTILRNLFWRFGTRPLLGIAADRIAPEAMGARRRRRAVRQIPGWVAPDPALRRELVDRAKANVPERLKPGRVYRTEMNQALDHALVAMELEEAFECGRRLGMRFGHPFWDADLLTFLYRTPPELLNQGGRSKGLVRGMLARRFPELGFERHRKITGTPAVRTMFTLEGEAAWRKMGGVTALAKMGVLDEAGTSRLLGGVLNENTRKSPEKNANAYRIWDILALEAWARSHS